MRARFRLGAEGVAPERLRTLVEWAEAHSPVKDALGRVVVYESEVEVV